MGTVYRAWDKELERTVALKLIRRDLTRDPNISQRFKQEVLAASKISHRNVLRIHDLGDGPGDTKFISMACVEGQDLHRLLKKERKLPLERALNIAGQICAALDAAHAEGVVHRDLKPQNILIDQHDHIYVSDFGLAKSLESDLGMTLTGQLLGTPRYMSPEQAEIRPIDHRSDLYSLGLILCELLTGHLPFERAESALQLMYQRVHEPAKDPRQLNPDLPEYLARIIRKCLERDVTQRYQSAAEILADLDAGRPPAVTLRSRYHHVVDVLPGGKRKWIPVSAIALLLVISLLAIPSIRRVFLPASGTAKPATVTPAVSLAIVPFRNASGDAGLDWLGPVLADMLSTDVGQSSSLRVVSSDRVHQVLHDLRIAPDTPLDPPTLRRLSEFSNADVLVSGQYARFGEQIRIDASVRDLKRDRTAALNAEAQSEKQVVAAVDRLAQDIRKNLSLSESAVKELQTQAFIPTSKSLQALRNYNEGLQLSRQGKNLEAQKQFQASIQQDPDFALAYARLAQADASLGHESEAEQHSRKAVDLSESLPPRERYRIIASHARIMKDYPKALESYENIARASPGDTDVQFTLASLYEETGNFPKAREHYAAVLKADPQSVEVLWKMGGVEILSGNPQGSLDYLNRGLTLSIQTENDEKKALILQAIGIAYRGMNKPEEALRNYQESLAIQRRLGQKRGAAASLSEMAQVYSLLGKPDAALASLDETLRLEREIGAKKEAGDTLIDLGNFYEERGQHDKALETYRESLQIQRDAGDETYQALCLNNIGICHFAKGNYEDALTYYQQALQLREKLKVPGDIAESVHNLAEANVKLGQYDQALRQYLRALDLHRGAGDKRTAAIDSFGLGTLYGHQGRYGAAVSAEEEALKTFRELQDRSPTMADILSGYGGALVQAGRWEEAQKALGEALSLAREIKSQHFVAQTLNFQGDLAFYRGDFKSAQTSYGQALQAASRTKDRDKVLASRIGLAKVAIREGRSREAVSSFKSLAQEADSLGLKYLSVECSVELAEALIGSKDYSRARQELESSLRRAEKLGLRTLLTKVHYFLGTALRLTGNAAEATPHYREARRLLDEIRKEAGAEKVIERADLKPILEASAR